MACCLSTGGILSYRGNNFNTPSASVSLLTGSRTATSLSLNAKHISSGTLHSAFTPSSLSLSSASYFSGSRKFDVFLLYCLTLGCGILPFLFKVGNFFKGFFSVTLWVSSENQFLVSLFSLGVNYLLDYGCNAINGWGQDVGGLYAAFLIPCLKFHIIMFVLSSLGLGFNASIGNSSDKRRGLEVRASRFRLCQTKRNRSRKSLARTHGFRKRISTTSGRAVIKRRRALCTKTNPNSGKRA